MHSNLEKIWKAALLRGKGLDFSGVVRVGSVPCCPVTIGERLWEISSHIPPCSCGSLLLPGEGFISALMQFSSCSGFCEEQTARLRACHTEGSWGANGEGKLCFSFLINPSKYCLPTWQMRGFLGTAVMPRVSLENSLGIAVNLGKTKSEVVVML